jgi:phosphoribosyl-dephospho-CoA transferase
MKPRWKVHDLLRVDAERLREALVLEDASCWELAEANMRRAPFAVVRRAPMEHELVPVGKRSQSREVRLAAFLRPAWIAEVIPPESLRCSASTRQMPVFSALARLEQDGCWREHVWGPTGSAGFELASGVETVSLASDLDLILRAPKSLPVPVLRQLAEACRSLPTAVDIQVETPCGAFSLQEYLSTREKLLLRTELGPELTYNPWLPSPLRMVR